jgi:uncharacterized membrane-anchored protein
MMTARDSQPIRTAIAGALCLSILSGLLVVHAWPLWTGQAALLPVTPVDPRDMFRGEYVRLDTPATRLAVRSDAAAPAGTAAVTPLGSWWTELPTNRYDRYQALVDRVVYIQLEARGDGGESRPVSISDEPIAGRVNLRGRISQYEGEGERLNVDYGLDSYFMQEGTAKPVEDALRQRRHVQMQIAIASSGHARIRRLLVDGVPVGQ